MLSGYIVKCYDLPSLKTKFNEGSEVGNTNEEIMFSSIIEFESIAPVARYPDIRLFLAGYQAQSVFGASLVNTGVFFKCHLPSILFSSYLKLSLSPGRLRGYCSEGTEAQHCASHQEAGQHIRLSPVFRIRIRKGRPDPDLKHDPGKIK